MIFYDKQFFGADNFDGGVYCDFNSSAASAIAGKDILLGVWKADGSAILAVAGQQTLTINRSADTIEVSTKDTTSGWKSSIAGMKSWDISIESLYIKDDASQTILSTAFEAGNPVCIKVYDAKAAKGMFGGLAAITTYNLEFPSDDAAKASITFSGIGKLTDLTTEVPATDNVPM